MGASVRELVEADDIVRGIRYQAHDGRHEVRVVLTVGADGRFSRLRRLSGLPPAVKTPCGFTSQSNQVTPKESCSVSTYGAA